MRQHHELIRALGGDIVAIGTGNLDYALSFVADERIPYLVLVDDDAQAAAAASVPEIPWARLLHPRSWRATWQTYRRGHRIHAPGKRVQQVGATFVVGPGDRVRYAHVDADGPDHAPLDDMLGVVASVTLRP